MLMLSTFSQVTNWGPDNESLSATCSAILTMKVLYSVKELGWPGHFGLVISIICLFALVALLLCDAYELQLCHHI